MTLKFMISWQKTSLERCFNDLIKLKKEKSDDASFFIKRDDLSPNRQQKVVWKKVTLTTISNILMTNLILVND